MMPPAAIVDRLTPMPKLVLFDIDGTLVLTGRAGLRAMNRACEEVVGHRDALDGIAGRGPHRLDHPARRAAARSAATWTTSCSRGCATCTSCILREEIELPGEGVKAVMPGIRELLDALARARRRVPRAADRQLRAGRADQAGALRSVALLPLRRVRRRRRGSECAGAVRARAGATLRAGGGRAATRCSWSATRRTTSPVRARRGGAGRRRDRHVQRADLRASGAESCSRI